MMIRRRIKLMEKLHKKYLNLFFFPRTSLEKKKRTIAKHHIHY
jgi:hypothetical protein